MQYLHHGSGETAGDGHYFWGFCEENPLLLGPLPTAALTWLELSCFWKGIDTGAGTSWTTDLHGDLIVVTLVAEQQRLPVAARNGLIVVTAMAAAALALLMRFDRAGLVAALTAGVVYGGVLVLVRRGFLRTASLRFGAANMITLGRAAISAVLAGIAAEALLRGRASIAADAISWTIAALATAGWVLDAVDGWIARRLNLASNFGARFDMEVDALFILALALLAYAGDRAGVWILLAGVLRYLFMAAGLAAPALAAPLAPSLRRKAICALMGAALIAALVPLVPPSLCAIFLGMGVLALLWSFGVDTLLLLRRAAQFPVALATPVSRDALGGVDRSR